ncbi:MAG: twin-arginine translocase TatA/TatE family subunit, partial [Candidatus Sumerlaeota bacterium]
MMCLESISRTAMWSPGWPEMVILLALALIIFGPKRLPQLSRSIGRSIRDFKK